MFTAAAPNELRLTEIMECKTTEGKLYLCKIKDVFPGQNVEYLIDSRTESRLAVPTRENPLRCVVTSMAAWLTAIGEANFDEGSPCRR